MIEKPLYRKIVASVGKAHGPLAAQLVLLELADIFEEFALEIQDLFDEDPENDDISKGYWFAADWCQSWAEEIEKDNG
jgi:hypothetical protein